MSKRMSMLLRQEPQKEARVVRVNYQIRRYQRISNLVVHQRMVGRLKFQDPHLHPLLIKQNHLKL